MPHGYSAGGTYRAGRTYVDGPGSVYNRECGGGICLGILMLIFLVGAPMWSYSAETEYHERFLAFEEMEAVLRDCRADRPLKECVSEAKQPVYLVSNQVSATAQDPDFGVRLPGLALERVTEYCQWDETRTRSCQRCKRRVDGKEEEYDCNCVTKFHYIKSWRSHRINSLTFDQPAAHHNPMRDPYPGSKFVSQDAQLGSIKVLPEVINNKHGAFRATEHPIEWTRDANREPQWYDFIARFFGIELGKGVRYHSIDEIRDTVNSPAARGKDRFVYVGQGGYFFSPYEGSRFEQLFKYFVEYLEGSLFDWQVGDILPSCTAGDIRVSFRVQDPETVSAIGGSIETGGDDLALGYFTTSRGYEVAILHEHQKTAYEMFDYEAKQAKYMCYAARVALVLWGAMVAHMIGAFFGRSIEDWVFKWASGVAVGGCTVAIQWICIWRMEFGTDWEDLSVILLFIVASAVGFHVAKKTQVSDSSGFWGLWVWFAATAGMPPTWRGSVVVDGPASVAPTPHHFLSLCLCQLIDA